MRPSRRYLRRQGKALRLASDARVGARRAAAQRGHQVDGPHRRHGGAAQRASVCAAYGQRDPVVEYRIEGFDMFDEMVASIREDTSRMLLTMELRTEQPLQREQVAKPIG